MEKKFKYIFKDVDGKYFSRIYSFEEIRGGILSDFVPLKVRGENCEIAAGPLQYIGMEDCLGTKIFEGDRIELQLDKLPEDERGYWEPMKFEVTYSDEYARFAFKRLELEWEEAQYLTIDKENMGKYYKVIGSVYETKISQEG